MVCIMLSVLLCRSEVREFFQLDRRKLSSEDGSVDDGEEGNGGSDVSNSTDKLNLGPSERTQ
jgi:hypothetical protein